jgi:hypothetical protein
MEDRITDQPPGPEPWGDVPPWEWPEGLRIGYGTHPSLAAWSRWCGLFGAVMGPVVALLLVGQFWPTSGAWFPVVIVVCVGFATHSPKTPRMRCALPECVAGRSTVVVSA